MSHANATTHKIVRSIVRIDEDKCTGCGLCVPACEEGAIKIIDGKASLVSDRYCDGLGACLGECPEGAIFIEEREAQAFDEQAVKHHLEAQHAKQTAHHAHHADHAGCPSARALRIERESRDPKADPARPSSQSALSHWPVQLKLLPPDAPFFENADLLLVADCVPFAYAAFHEELLKENALAIGCPKLDDPELYRQKLTQILKHSNVKSLTVVHMEVPCCFGLVQIARQAVADSGKDIPFNALTISISGERLK